MDSDTALSRIDVGSLRAIFENPAGRATQPVVQCVQIKPMTSASGEGSERYRVVVADVNNYVQTMLATSLNEEIHSGRLQKGAIVQLTSFQSNVVKQKR